MGVMKNYINRLDYYGLFEDINFDKFGDLSFKFIIKEGVR